MRPTTALPDNVVDLNAIIHPGTVFEHPRDVVSHPTLSLSEKRATLASWASDASAIASCPSLRAPEGLKAPVTIDEILEALCALDEGPRHPPGGKPMRLRPVDARRLRIRGATKMLDENLARIRAHRNNIHRYRNLLQTRLSDIERQFIERRLSEESSKLEALTSRAFPIALTMPQCPGPLASTAAAP